MALTDVSEKTGISLGLLITLGAILVSGFGTAVVAVYRVGALETSQQEHKADEEKAHDKLEATAAAAAKDAQAQDKRLTVVETNLTNMTATLGRIEGKLDGKVVQAKGHGL
jgi:hypothetical protein